MKTTIPCLILTAVCLSLFAFASFADDITALQSGNWSDTNTWSSGTVPGENDDVDVPAGINVLVDTNVTIQFIYDSGTVTMGAGATLRITTDSAIAPETTLNALATSNTVIYSANAYDAKPQNYYNLVFDGLGTFYNGATPNYPAATDMAIAGDLTISGTANIQAGANITVGGNLTIGTTNIATSLDCSVAAIVVNGNTVVNGFLMDLDGRQTNSTGGIETNQFKGSLTLNPGATWNVSDVTSWSVGGSFTNLGTIKSKGYGSINFNGAGHIAGNPFQIKTISVSGNYAIDTTITLATNTPTLTGTLVFDIARTNQIVLLSYPANPLTLYYSGALTVVNSGAAPASGASYKFFSATSFDGAFSSISYPSLPGGLSWVDNLVASGSIAVSGTAAAPMLTISRSGSTLTLSWDSATFPGYHVQAQTNSAGLTGGWSDTGSGTTSPFMIDISPGNPPVFFRLSNP